VSASVADATLGSLRIEEPATGYRLLMTPFIPSVDVLTGGGFQGIAVFDAQIASLQILDAGRGSASVVDAGVGSLLVNDFGL
jgi:hypothetical protein